MFEATYLRGNVFLNTLILFLTLKLILLSYIFSNVEKLHIKLNEETLVRELYVSPIYQVFTKSRKQFKGRTKVNLQKNLKNLVLFINELKIFITKKY